ncbi:MAG: hypothetical protein KatS3mg104_2884 [Phycisphaerae bacterium]|jgi:multiple sugar transport system permease protein|nr:MAG: hypothetical protein KatS3mg104_2884 [Phycisphaerae bacterium]
MTLMQTPKGPTPIPTPGPTPGIHPELSPPTDQPFFTRQKRQLVWGLLFLSPNLIGFLVFTLIPLVLSLILAFSNWDLRLHNDRKSAQLAAAGESPEWVRFVGLDHFIRLFTDDNFWYYLGNTLFFMIGLPIGIALSLISAILLSKDLRGGSLKSWVIIFFGAVTIASFGILSAIGLGSAGITILLTGIFGLILVGGSVGGQTIYRTLFYIPNFTAGVATMLLWKKMYNPVNGPINDILSEPVDLIGRTIGQLPQQVMNGILLLMLGLGGIVIHLCATRLLRLFRDGEIGGVSAILGLFFLIVAPVTVVVFRWLPGMTYDISVLMVTVLGLGLAIARVGIHQDFFATASEGVGSSMMLSVGGMSAVFGLVGLGLAFHHLPVASADGLTPPNWLQDVYWAKPALMIMGLWGAIGSQTMLLYLAALTNVPGELYEAADIDGASPGQKFWNVTWPQLAPTTFFVVVMGVIGGLQGGFEMARVMTYGGPAGSTTTLAYFIYTEGFETGRLGFSSAVSWTMFLMVLIVTLFNWKFGNRYVND